MFRLISMRLFTESYVIYALLLKFQTGDLVVKGKVLYQDLNP